MNLRKIKRKYWLSLLLSPLTLIPFVGGVTSFFIFGALGKMFSAGLLLLGGLVVGTGGFGVFWLPGTKPKYL